MIEAQILDFKILTSGRDTMKKFSVIILYTIIIVSCSPETTKSTVEVVGEWHHAGGSHFSEKYAALDQINTKNFNDLEIAWRWQSIDVLSLIHI